jgi:hypothetical protein
MKITIRNKTNLYMLIVLVEVVILGSLVLIGGLRQDKTEEKTNITTTMQTGQLPSIFTVLPYEKEGFSVYYFKEDKKFYLVIKQPPYNQNLQDALLFLHQYEETKNFTENDIQIVTSAPIQE